MSLPFYAADGRLKRRIRGSGCGWTVTAEESRYQEWDGSPTERTHRTGTWIPSRISPTARPIRAFHSAVLGSDEMVWIGIATRPDEQMRHWLVIGPDDQPREWSDLPAQASVLAVDNDRYVLVQRDALG